MSTTTGATKPLLNQAKDQSRLSQHGEFTPANEFLGSLYIILDLIWKTFIVAVAIVVVVLSKNVTTKVPLKVWVIGYAALRVLHMIYSCINYWRWREAIKALFRSVDSPNSRHAVLDQITNCLQIVKSVLNVIWWIIGACWMFSGRKTLAYDAPKLFWFTAIFLALDLFYVFIFYGMSCIDYAAALL